MRSAAAAAPAVGRAVAAGPRGGRALFRAALSAGLAAAVLAGLALVTLRNDLIRIRYRLSEALRHERELHEEQRALEARLGALRDPTRLAQLARERGFARPERTIDLRRRGAAAP